MKKKAEYIKCAWCGEDSSFKKPEQNEPFTYVFSCKECGKVTFSGTPMMSKPGHEPTIVSCDNPIKKEGAK